MLFWRSLSLKTEEQRHKENSENVYVPNWKNVSSHIHALFCIWLPLMMSPSLSRLDFQSFWYHTHFAFLNNSNLLTVFSFFRSKRFIFPTIFPKSDDTKLGMISRESKEIYGIYWQPHDQTFSLIVLVSFTILNSKIITEWIMSPIIIFKRKFEIFVMQLLQLRGCKRQHFLLSAPLEDADREV